MADSLFDQDGNQEIDYLLELTKPGAKFDRTKYADEAEMYKAIAKGKYHGDRALDFKNQEFDELREDFIKVRSQNVTQEKLGDIVNKYENLSQNRQSITSDNNVQPVIDPSKLGELVASETQKAIQAYEAQKTEAQNLAVVDTRLRERFGDSAKDVLRDKMQALNLTHEDLKYLAKKSPDAVIAALGLNASQPNTYQNLPPSSVRTDSFKPTSDIRDAVYYEKLRKENPKEYFSEKMSVQRLKDMDNPDFLKRYYAG